MTGITPAIAPWLVVLAILLYGLVHSILASLTVKAGAEKLFGSWGKRAYRLFYNLFAFFSLLPVLALPGLLPDRILYTVPMPWVLLTLVIQAGAALTLAVGVMQTGAMSFLGLRQLTPAHPDKPASLVSHGLYRWVRHPLYTAGLILLWLIPRMTVNFLAFNLGWTVYILIGAVLEERKLVAEFGESYHRYRQQTPMLIPRKKLTHRAGSHGGSSART